uniref:Uncharacterized protein n=1 Tax=Meloidogyne floridensis TaxID=298350 RepID=A0A915PA86_9BILA
MVLQQYSVFNHITKAKSDSFDTEGSTSICKDSLQSYNNKIISLENEKNNKEIFNNEINKIKYPQEETEKYYESWLNHSPAWDHFCSVLTSLYALFIIVFAIVVELSQEFTSDEWLAETVLEAAELFYSV